MSLSFSDPRIGAWSRDSGVEGVGHPLQTSWARNMVPDVHSFMTSLGNPRGNSTIASTMGNIHKEVRFGSRLSSNSFWVEGTEADFKMLYSYQRDIISLFGKSIPLTG